MTPSAELFPHPDARTGYYVSAMDAGRYALVDGPYATHNEALAMVDTIQRAYCQRNPWGDFYGWGTTAITARELPEKNHIVPLDT